MTSVPTEESNHQNVTAQMDSTLKTKKTTTSVDHVTQNVKNALTLLSVLNVLTNLTELPQKNVNVTTDIMKPVPPNVQNVTTNVPPVPLMITVLSVLNQELVLQNVHVHLTCSTKTEFVPNAHSDVKLVTNPQKTVSNVLKTESLTQLVVAQLDFMMTMSSLNVQNVTANVPPVTLKLV